MWAYQNKTITVGHVFIRLEPEGNTSLNRGKNFSRGFYADTTNTLRMIVFKKEVNGKIKHDMNTIYHKRKAFTITKKQYNTIKDFLYSAPKKYHIVKYNCASFAVDALNKAGVKHKFKKHYWDVGLSSNVYTMAMMCARAVNMTVSPFYVLLLNFALSYGYTPASMAYDIR